MGFYPFNPRLGQRIQTDAPGVYKDRSFLAHLVWANPAAQSVTAACTATSL